MTWALLTIALMTADPPAAPPPHVAVVAHRGLAEGVSENTLAAFGQSIEDGIQIIELDLRVTRDGQLVVMHDLTLDRTTNCTGLVADMDLAQIKRCDAGGGEQVPTFGEVISLVGHLPVSILADVKNGTPLAPVLEVVRSQGAQSRVILGLRSARHVARAREALPDTTILAYLPDIPDAAAFAEAGADIIRLWSDWVDADPALVARTQALGKQVWVMVGRVPPKKERQWRDLHARLIEAGAQGLITDRPDLISAP